MSKVLLEQNGHLATITINRPDQLNCFDYDTLLQLEEQVKSIQLDREVRAVIITGAGEKAFSAGADLKERRTLGEKEVRRNVNKIRDVFALIEELPQPTIAVVNGYALGGGFELALACDFRIAKETAKLGLPEVSMAIIPGAGGTQRLTQLIGPSKAKELILTARRIDALESEKIGIINQAVPQEKLMETAHELADEIMQNGPLAVIQAKHAIQQGSNVDIHTGMAIESKAYEVIIPTEDRVEALEAFREKRAPNFKGK
ncbi:Enoyl-CoA hydratase/carnithine racemase [Alteribacillus persepolensis]|uniref:Enoyl-CoA hydratase/carnithine racemase n=1 Tax=Alteribacillus persepolensis TaxID=568899 RepID=A0A1G8GCD3_9BACI|nr:enoyl-CoA hydratase-related protein [Alteribacillus persepolensis]SDH91976.1 Enoyl-CoA hydratase/carnithine racemase [Alteribacillus persepolensis]